MATTPDSYTSQASQYVKEVYAPRVVRLYPEANFLVKNIAFNAANRVGKNYTVPIELAPEQGVTYAAAAAGGFALNGAQALTTSDAVLTPAQIVVQRTVDYESIQRTVGSKAAFVSFIDATLRSVVALATKRLELCMLWGQFPAGLAQIASVDSTGGSGATAYASVTISSGEWSGGLWGGMDNAMVTVLSGSGTGASFVASGQRNATSKWYSVQTIGLAAHTLRLVDTQSDGTTGNIAATDVIVAFGAQQYASATLSFGEMAGLAAISMNAGTYAGISAATSSLWAGNSLTSWGTPSLGKILTAVSTLVERGLDEDVVVLVSPKHFAQLNSDQTALRLYTSAGGTAQNGWQSIEFASENGKIMIRSHRFMKDGYAVGFPLSKCQRIGSTELTFTNMGVDGDIFLQVSGYAQVELRGYLGQALLVTAPSRCFLASGVTYP